MGRRALRYPIPSLTFDPPTQALTHLGGRVSAYFKRSPQPHPP
jgi:hypothetical protein